jgi:hypothetical protein
MDDEDRGDLMGKCRTVSCVLLSRLYCSMMSFYCHHTTCSVLMPLLSRRRLVTRATLISPDVEEEEIVYRPGRDRSQRPRIILSTRCPFAPLDWSHKRFTDRSTTSANRASLGLHDTMTRAIGPNRPCRFQITISAVPQPLILIAAQQQSLNPQ